MMMATDSSSSVPSLTRVCEHHLPFVLGTILEWINEDLVDEVCPALPAHVHYGVADREALELLTHGVRSRRLAAWWENGPAQSGSVMGRCVNG